MEEKVNKKGYPIKEYRLTDKFGEITYQEGTLYEVSDYALRHQLLIVKDDTCKNCGYWGGCDSTGEIRKCYHRDVYSDAELEMTKGDDTCRGFIAKMLI